MTWKGVARTALLVAGIALSLPGVVLSARINARGLSLAGDLAAKAPLPITSPAIDSFARSDCQKHWLLGLSAWQNGDAETSTSEWSTAVACDRSYVTVARTRQPDNVRVAEAAVAAHPDSWVALFWLADLLRDTDTVRAVALAQRGLQYNPGSGLGWYRLGELLERESQLVPARDAFMRSCEFLNQGSDCYVRAGQIEEKLGRPREAIQLYRRSIFEGAHIRAAQIEQELGR